MAAIYPLGHAFIDCDRQCGRCHWRIDACQQPAQAHEPNGTPIRDALLKICSWCKKVIQEGDRTQPPSHGICPGCADRLRRESPLLAGGMGRTVAGGGTK